MRCRCPCGCLRCHRRVGWAATRSANAVQVATALLLNPDLTVREFGDRAESSYHKLCGLEKP